MHAKRGVLSQVILCALLSLAFSNTARAWWDSEWTLRKKITLDTSGSGAAITEPVGAVPVLIRLYDGNFRFTNAKPDGSDIRFVGEDDKTLLTYHIEKFDPLLNEAFVWVKVPDLKTGTKNVIWLYYGNGGSKAVKVEDSKGTYDENTVLVYHFSEHGQPAYDFTANGNNAANAGTPSDSAIIGTGLRLDGRNSITIPPAASFSWQNGAQVTWSSWVKLGSIQPKAIIFSRRSSGKAFVVGVDNGVPFVEVRGGGNSQRSTGGAPIAPNAWRHLAVAAGGGRVTLYLDGEQYASLTASIPSFDGQALVGGDASEGEGFIGELDEMEISRSARPASAIKLAAVSQGGDSASKFISFGEDEQQTSWLSALKTGYIGVIIGSLSIDGWVVIGILGVMSAISWVVMIAKALYLNRAVKGNARFLREWSQVAADLSVLEEGDGEKTEGAEKAQAADKAKVASTRPPGKGSLALAPLYHIYHIGVEEIRHRLSAERQGSGAKVLSARSIQAIRASLDAGLVRETQKLNSHMVLLTIAISGGPFLGLLGTVVGVMITFAAVAQAGDVNVNAIAPGIAAALAATVAGLTVAIPALFGYNYLLTRIKATVSDVHVFIDEFVTKLAEFYSEPHE
jgi:biopolymer transport protein ExbB